MLLHCCGALTVVVMQSNIATPILERFLLTKYVLGSLFGNCGWSWGVWGRSFAFLVESQGALGAELWPKNRFAT